MFSGRKMPADCRILPRSKMDFTFIFVKQKLIQTICKKVEQRPQKTGETEKPNE